MSEEEGSVLSVMAMWHSPVSHLMLCLTDDEEKKKEGGRDRQEEEMINLMTNGEWK